MRIIALALSLRAVSALALESPLAVIRTLKPTVGEPITFGLSRRQLDAIHQIGGPGADLRDLYRVEDHDLPRIDWKTAQLEGWLDRVPVPPPGFYTAADPSLGSEWWHQKLELDKVWVKATGKGVTIADCDAGYYTAEPDLTPNLVLDKRYDLADKDNPLVVDDGNYTSHGTSVAAILIGALDGKGTNGIAYGAKLVPLQNFNYSSADDLDKEEATAKCILRAIDTPSVKVIVLENQTVQGSSETFVGTRSAVRLALRAGIVVVGAGGNYAKELTIEAGDDTGSIIVGAVNGSAKQETFSNYGKRISVAAYGSNLHTLSGPNGALGSFGGTSGATPQVAATVALMLERNGSLLPAQVREILERTRITGADNQDVGGMLNVVAAVDSARVTRADGLLVGKAKDFRRQLRAILAKP